jgi:hypothetical protein
MDDERAACKGLDDAGPIQVKIRTVTQLSLESNSLPLYFFFNWTSYEIVSFKMKHLEVQRSTRVHQRLIRIHDY